MEKGWRWSWEGKEEVFPVFWKQLKYRIILFVKKKFYQGGWAGGAERSALSVTSPSRDLLPAAILGSQAIKL